MIFKDNVHKERFEELKTCYACQLNEEARQAKKALRLEDMGRKVYAGLYLAAMDDEIFELVKGRTSFPFFALMDCGSVTASLIRAFDDYRSLQVPVRDILFKKDMTPYYLEAFAIAYPEFAGHNNRQAGEKTKMPQETIDKIVDMRDRERKSFVEISRCLEIPLSTVKHRYYTTIKKLSIDSEDGNTRVYQPQLIRSKTCSRDIPPQDQE